MPNHDQDQIPRRAGRPILPSHGNGLHRPPHQLEIESERAPSVLKPLVGGVTATDLALGICCALYLRVASARPSPPPSERGDTASRAKAYGGYTSRRSQATTPTRRQNAHSILPTSKPVGPTHQGNRRPKRASSSPWALTALTPDPDREAIKSASNRNALHHQTTTRPEQGKPNQTPRFVPREGKRREKKRREEAIIRR